MSITSPAAQSDCLSDFVQKLMLRHILLILAGLFKKISQVFYHRVTVGAYWGSILSWISEWDDFLYSPMDITYSRTIGIQKIPSKVAKKGVIDGKILEKPVASVAKLMKAPKERTPWGWLTTM